MCPTCPSPAHTSNPRLTAQKSSLDWFVRFQSSFSASNILVFAAFDMWQSSSVAWGFNEPAVRVRVHVLWWCIIAPSFPNKISICVFICLQCCLPALQYVCTTPQSVWLSTNDKPIIITTGKKAHKTMGCNKVNEQNITRDTWSVHLRVLRVLAQTARAMQLFCVKSAAVELLDLTGTCKSISVICRPLYCCGIQRETVRTLG